MTSFLVNSSYSFHQTRLKLGGQLDHLIVKCILFQDHTTPNFYRVITISKDFSDMTWFPDFSLNEVHETSWTVRV